MEWISRLFGHGSVSIENREGLSREIIGLLQKDFASLKAIGADVPSRALRYVLDDEGPDLLATLARSKRSAEALKIKATGGWTWMAEPGPRDKLFSDFVLDKPAVYLRLAHVYEAAARSGAARAGTLPELPSWFEVFLREVFDLHPNVISSQNKLSPFPAEILEKMLQIDGTDPNRLYQAALGGDGTWKDPAHSLRSMLADRPDFAKRLNCYPDVVRAALLQKQATHRAHTLVILLKADVGPLPIIDTLVDLAVEESKKVRPQACELLKGVKEQAIPLLKQRAVDGKPTERGYALEALHAIDHEGCRPFFEERMEADSTQKVKDTLRDLLVLSVPAAKAESAGQPAKLEIPPLLPLDLEGRLDEEMRAVVRQFVAECDAVAQAYCDKTNRANSQSKHARHKIVSPVLGARQADRIFDRLRALDLSSGESWKIAEGFLWHTCEAPLRKILQHPNIQLIHVVRLSALMGELCRNNRFQGGWWLGYQFEQLVNQHRTKHQPRYGLRELAAVLRALGIDDAALADAHLSWYGSRFRWEAEHTWPYFAESIHLLEEVFDTKTLSKFDWYQRNGRRKQVFRVLATFPLVPPSLEGRLWDLALGSNKADRMAAQACVESSMDRDERLINALASGKRETRVAAADWISRLKIRQAGPVLRQALTKEKSEEARAALMTAMEAIGVSVDEYMNREGLAAEAAQGLSKGIPADLGWFPFDLLPPVRWADGDHPVDPQIIRWFLVQSCRFNKPEPGPMLRRYVAGFRREDAERLGQFVLQAWIGQDTITNDPAKAAEQAQQTVQQYKRWGMQVPDNLYEQMYQASLKAPAGSAIQSKGVLAVAAAGCSGEAATIAEQYLKTWYGMRSAQCKALLEMLSWIDHPAAIQVLLAVANRFRTAGIRKEAQRLAEAIAERRDWTVNELADRTIPTAGFDERGELKLNYGSREFIARLDEEFRPVIATADGKSLKSLPAPGKSDDPELAKAAKKQFSAAQKEIKNVLRLQRERLYEGLCTQRHWRFEDWEVYLNRHPIVRKYCQRLVWAVIKQNQLVATYRPLDDGSLSDAEDEPVTVEKDAAIRLAHDCNTPETIGSRWRQHFTDYQVTPLFEQFGKQSYTLQENKRYESSIDEFMGHVVNSFKLRGEAARLGYSRGQAQDGGWFYTYHKHFPTLGLEAVLEFSGNTLPEENRDVALQHLKFERQQQADQPDYGGASQTIALGEVPPVLLSECWNDIRVIAASGSGFDPNWEQKVGW